MNRAPPAHEWVKVGRHLWRCPWCGSCRKSVKKPDAEALNSKDAQLQYAALQRDKTI